jgi:hypothetical protein
VLTDQPFRKFFKGQGVALGGWLREPVTEVIPSQASAAMPLSGGMDQARVSAFNHREILSFKSAHTFVSGKETDGKLETLVTTVVEGLDILGVVTADRIVARLAGSHPVAEKQNPIVTPSGSYFQNLRIRGEEVTCRFVGDCFDKLVCDSGYLGSLPKNEDLQDQILPSDGWTDKGFLPISLCADVCIGGEECDSKHKYIDVPHFGRVFLSEFIVSRTSHRLTMLRVELGCPVRGSMSAGDVEGEPYIMP